VAIFEIIVTERRAQKRKLLSSETQSHERLNGTFRFSPTKFVSVTVHVILQTYFLDNFSINVGKSVFYIESFQISLVQRLLALLISVLFYSRNKSIATNLIVLQITNCRQMEIILHFSALNIHNIENCFK
jgi:hypothetical protein